MPAVFITLDYMDGRSQIKGPLYPDQIDLTGLLFRLNESELATVTFTRARPLDPLLKEASHDRGRAKDDPQTPGAGSS